MSLCNRPEAVTNGKLACIQVLRGATIKSMENTTRLTSDAFMVRCSAADRSSYTNVHSAVVPTQQVRARDRCVTDLDVTSVLRREILMLTLCRLRRDSERLNFDL